MEYRVKPWHQTLLHRNVALKDYVSLEDAGISHGDTLTLVVKVHAAPLWYASPSSPSDEEEDY